MATKRARREEPDAKPVPAPSSQPADLPPIAASLAGILKNADPEAYRKHLIRKYL